MAYRPQTHEYFCLLCPQPPAEGPGFVGASGREIVEHVVAHHGVERVMAQSATGRARAFIDGRRGSAKQVYLYTLSDRRPMCEYVWSSGDFALPPEERKVAAAAAAKRTRR
jgi:hypothetical protein